MSKKRKVFVAPFFEEGENGGAELKFNGEMVNKEWFKECRNALNKFLEEMSDKEIDQLNYINKYRTDI